MATDVTPKKLDGDCALRNFSLEEINSYTLRIQLLFVD
jgi:hypothetical protein